MDSSVISVNLLTQLRAAFHTCADRGHTIKTTWKTTQSTRHTPTQWLPSDGTPNQEDRQITDMARYLAIAYQELTCSQPLHTTNCDIAELLAWHIRRCGQTAVQRAELSADWIGIWYDVFDVYKEALYALPFGRYQKCVDSVIPA